MEPRLVDLLASWITPIDRFFVRNHGPIPRPDAGSFRLDISGLVRRTASFTVAELQDRFPARCITATLACAGNRRAEMAAQRAIPGVPWLAGAIGNAEWTGVRLADVLQSLEVAPDAKHVWLEGLDQHQVEGETTVFGGSIPIHRVMTHGVGGDVILATHMNGCPLTAEHGAPLRVIVPGYIGARSVKWLTRMVLSEQPSPNHYIAKAYRIADSDRPDGDGRIIYELPLQSYFTPLAMPGGNGDELIRLRGYAHATGLPDRTIAGVEWSLDDGRNWQSARLDPQSRPYCWRLWSAELPRPDGTRLLLARARESTGAVQPRHCPWNAKGYLFNGWPSLPVRPNGSY